jgi:hypothetical protein
MMNLMAILVGGLIIFAALQVEEAKGYRDGFRNGTQDAYSHIDDNVCKR